MPCSVQQRGMVIIRNQRMTNNLLGMQGIRFLLGISAEMLPIVLPNMPSMLCNNPNG